MYISNSHQDKTKITPSKRKYRLFLAAMMLILVILACGPPAAPTSDPNALSTAIQQTMIVHTLTALAANQQQPPQQQDQSQPGQQGQPPTATHTVQVVTVTPSATLPPTNTFTPSVPMVSVSVDTNCRFGPGKGYELLGALLVGEQAEIIARDPSGYYWYIKNPDRGGFCWLWGNYATTTGNTGSLPVFTPPATPTFTPTPTPEPEFTVVYTDVENCGDWHFDFRITNTGSIIWQSVSITVTDTVTGEPANHIDDEFKEYNACILNLATLQADLAPGEVGFSPSGGLSADPAGHQIDASIKLCSEDALGGTCITKNLSFTP